MDVFPDLQHTRALLLSVHRSAPDRLRFHAALDDAEHALRLWLEVDPRRIVTGADLYLPRTPLPGCPAARWFASDLIGMRIGSGVPETLRDVLGKGCFHVLEAVQALDAYAANTFLSLRVGWNAMHPPGPGTETAMRRAGCTSCAAFA